MISRPWVFLALVGTGLPLAAQQAQPPARPTPTVSVSLAEALEQAQRNSPAYRQVLNNAGAARWSVRSAYSNVLLPSLDVGGSMGYTGSGSATFGGSLFNQSSPSLTSGYGLQLSWQLSGTTLAAPGQQRAEQHAISEDISGAYTGLRYDVTFQYLTALQASAQTDVARQQVARNQDFLSLAQARYQVGQATILDVRQAQVQKGQADVALLRAQQAENEAKLELFRRMGIRPPASVELVALTDSLQVTEPAWQLDQLLPAALEQNPALRALKARESSARWSVRAQRSRFLPSLRFSAGWNGFTQQFTNSQLLINQAVARAQGTAENCQFQNDLIHALPQGGIPNRPNGGIVSDCNDYAGLDATGQSLQESIRGAIVKQNEVFPFHFTGQPFQATLQVSLPIFDNWSRNLAVAQAQANREDASESVRARDLQVRMDVESRYLALQTSWRAIAVQQANREAARDQLRLAQDRYRLGSGSALEISDAQNAVQRAEGDYVNAQYDYHKAIAALELVVGRPLR